MPIAIGYLALLRGPSSRLLCRWAFCRPRAALDKHAIPHGGDRRSSSGSPFHRRRRLAPPRFPQPGPATEFSLPPSSIAFHVDRFEDALREVLLLRRWQLGLDDRPRIAPGRCGLRGATTSHTPCWWRGNDLDVQTEQLSHTGEDR